MDHCPICSAELTGSGVRCSSCGASLTVAQPTIKQPPAASGGQRKSSSSTTTTSSGQGSFISGTVLDGRYRIVALLGRGGMGEVYKAEDLKLDHEVALKFLPESFAKDAAGLTRFRTEVRIARQVTHQNVCRVFDIGEFEGRHFLTMEYIDGEDLSSLLRRIGRLPADKALEVSRQICAGLAAAHGAGVLHRDLKPANVMIDGRGKARITDFGIAGLEEDLKKGGVIAGTPAYMSPEQITGKEITVQSDIYSLGLVLYELFTGKPAVQSDSINELVRKHKTITPTNPSEILKEIDPLVEKTILRCLEKDPRERPESALQVAAMLPGGDPLAAALAAGETPSPEMVAAAPKKGALKPAIAVACLASVVALFAFIVFFSGKVKLNEWVPLDKPPEVLAERANQIKNKLGYADAPADTVYSFGNTSAYIDYATREVASADRFEKIRTGQPTTLYFWYRTSPDYLVPHGGHEVNLSDPPNDVSGMTRLSLDVRGRLIYFEAVPPQLSEQTTQNIQTDWSTLFSEAGLDIHSYTETKSQWAPPTFADERKAWEGRHVDHTEIPVRIEGAAFQGRAVYFEVIFPWDKPTRQVEAGTNSTSPTIIVIAVLVFGVLFAGMILARYNLKAGRGDIKGASKLAVFIFSAMTLAQLIDANHVPDLFGELWIFSRIAGTSFLLTIFPWIFYIALEPFIRRRWPELIISWSRLMAGDFRDPLVGRDILVGGLLGLVGAAANYLGVLLRQWSGIAYPPLGSPNITEPLSGVGGQLTHFLFIFAEHINFAIAFTFLLLLLLAILRKKWLAIPAFGLIYSIPYLEFASGDPWIVFLSPLLIATAMTVATARFGVLALYSYFFFQSLSRANPITSDFSSWYAGSTLFVFVVLIGLAVFGFYTSLAGQRLLKGKLLHD
jgi:eukaryotic-like serine/threonine-protein kinase